MRDGMARTDVKSDTMGLAQMIARVEGAPQEAIVAVTTRPKATGHGDVHTVQERRPGLAKRRSKE